MQKLFENWRGFTNLIKEEQLLVEGRIDDAKIKYPELAKQREELDGESLLDVLVLADPSDNQKYLMGAARILQNSMEASERKPDTLGRTFVPFWGKKWPEDADDNLYSPWGIANNIAGELSKFHKLQPLIQVERRDINTIKDYAGLSSVVSLATIKQQRKEREKREKEEFKRRATEETYDVYETDYHKVFRPMSHESCIQLGKTHGYCISQPDAPYWDDYTSEAKAFYFVRSKNLPRHASGYNIVLQYDTKGFGGQADFESAWDNENESWNLTQLHGGIAQGILGVEVYDEIVSFEEEEPYDVSRVDSTLKDFIEPDPALYDDTASLWMQFKDEILASYVNELLGEVETHAAENPTGPSEEQYNEILANYEPGLNHIGVSLEMPYDTGASQPYWNAYLSIDIEDYVKDNKQRLKWKKSEEQIAEEEDELRQAVDLALNVVDIWPDNMEEEHNNPFIYHVNLDPGSGTPTEFEGYMDNIQHWDERFSEGFAEALLEELVDRDLLGRDTREEEYWPDPEEKKKQLILPFETGTEEGAARERDLDYIRSPAGAALRQRVGLQESRNKKMKLTKDILRELILEELNRLYE